MCDRRSLRPVFLILVLLAVLACPAGAAPPAGKASHYPGQDCTKCHKLRGKSAEKAPAGSVPASGAATGTGAAGSRPATMPSPGRSPAR